MQRVKYNVIESLTSHQQVTQNRSSALRVSGVSVTMVTRLTGQESVSPWTLRPKEEKPPKVTEVSKDPKRQRAEWKMDGGFAVGTPVRD